MIKKNVFCISILLFVILISFSQEIKTYEKQLIKIIKAGTENEQLAYSPYGMGEGVPMGIGIDNLGYFYFVDNGNNRLVIYNNDLNFIKKVENKSLLSNTQQLEFDKNNNIIRRSSNRGLILYNKDFNYEFNFSLYQTKLLNINNYPKNDYFLLYKNIIFFYDRENNIHSILNPSSDNEQNKKNYRNTDETKQLVELKYKELTIDDKNRIILNGKILTRIYNDYRDFWDERHKKMTQPKNTISFEIAKSYDDLTYFGKDKDNNQYWGD